MVIGHPIFWDTSKRVNFVRQISNVIDQSSKDVKYQFEDFMRRGMPPSWKSSVDDLLWKHLTLHRPYIESNYTHLVRALRNLIEHWSNIVVATPDVSRLFGEDAGGILFYFERRFPNLFANLWAATTIPELSRFRKGNF